MTRTGALPSPGIHGDGPRHHRDRPRGEPEAPPAEPSRRHGACWRRPCTPTYTDSFPMREPGPVALPRAADESTEQQEPQGAFRPLRLPTTAQQSSGNRVVAGSAMAHCVM